MSDPIDRQAAIDAFEKELTVGKSNGKYEIICSAVTFEGAKQILEELPSVQQWIPCSERLPEKCGVYLVSGRNRVWSCEWVQMMTVYGWANDARNPVVTAWMPLPEPYAERREE